MAKSLPRRIGNGAVISVNDPAQAFIVPPKPTIMAHVTLTLTDEVPFEQFVRVLELWRK
jgi:hypothetical protein